MCLGRRDNPAPQPIPTPAPVPVAKVRKVKNPALAKRKASRRAGGQKSLVRKPTQPKGGLSGAGVNSKTYNA